MVFIVIIALDFFNKYVGGELIQSCLGIGINSPKERKEYKVFYKNVEKRRK